MKIRFLLNILAASLSASVFCAPLTWAKASSSDQTLTVIGYHEIINKQNALIPEYAVSSAQFEKHIEWLKKQLQKAMNDAVKKLEALNIQPVVLPKAGMFLWCKLPENIEAPKLSQLCLKKGVILAPGNSFSSARNAGQYMRFNVAQCIDKTVFDVLAEALREAQRASPALN